MTYLGTRPILQDELLKYELHHRARIAIKPGITGMWQVSGRSDMSLSLTSETAVPSEFHSRCHKEAILSTANILNLSKASVTSYLPYKKGVYFPSTEKEKISVGAERQRRYRVMKRWRVDPTEENFWGVVLAYAGIKFKTYSGLPFSYEIKKGKNGEYTKELWIDRREKSKSLAWSSIVLALGNIKEEVVDRPKALGDIRGVTYIYGMFYQFGLIDVPDKVKEKMGRPINRKK